MTRSGSVPERLWVVRRSAPAWGDYGTILLHGQASPLERVDGRLQLSRTGPYAPPISMPAAGSIVLNAGARASLEEAGVAGAGFRSVDKTHVVSSDWTTWDQSAEYPKVLPKSGEPEDYLLAQPHDPGVAAMLGEFWELAPVVGGPAASQQVAWGPPRFQLGLPLSSIPSAHAFNPGNKPRMLVVSERLRGILAAIDGRALRFEPVVVGDLPPPPPAPRHYLRPNEPVPEGYRVTHSTVLATTNETVRVAERIKP